jgi:citrate synthase
MSWGFPPMFATITGFASRVAGWLAHWLEQLKNNRIFRPEQINVGKNDAPYCRWKNDRDRSRVQR